MEPDSASDIVANQRLLDAKLKGQRTALDPKKDKQHDAWMLVGQLYDIKKDLKNNPNRYVGTCGVHPDSDGKQRAPDFRAVLKYAVADGSLLGGFKAKLNVSKLENDVIFYETALTIEESTAWFPNPCQLPIIRAVSRVRNDKDMLLAAFNRADAQVLSNPKCDRYQVARQCMIDVGWSEPPTKKRKLSTAQQSSAPAEGPDDDSDDGQADDGYSADDYAAADQADISLEAQLPEQILSAVKDGVSYNEIAFQQKQQELQQRQQEVDKLQTECTELRSQYNELSETLNSSTQQCTDLRAQKAAFEQQIQVLTAAAASADWVLSVYRSGVQEIEELLGIPKSSSSSSSSKVSKESAEQHVASAKEAAKAAVDAQKAAFEEKMALTAAATSAVSVAEVYKSGVQKIVELLGEPKSSSSSSSSSSTVSKESAEQHVAAAKEAAKAAVDAKQAKEEAEIVFAQQVTLLCGYKVQEGASAEVARTKATTAASSIKSLYDRLTLGIRSTVDKLQGGPSTDEAGVALVKALDAAAANTVSVIEVCTAGLQDIIGTTGQSKSSSSSSSSSTLNKESAEKQVADAKAAKAALDAASKAAKAEAAVFRASVQRSTAVLSGKPEPSSSSSSSSSSSTQIQESPEQQVQNLEVAVKASTKIINRFEEENLRLQQQAASRHLVGSGAALQLKIKQAAGHSEGSSSSHQPAAAAGGAAGNDADLTAQGLGAEQAMVAEVAATSLCVDPVPPAPSPDMPAGLLLAGVPRPDDLRKALAPHISDLIRCTRYHQQEVKLDPPIEAVAAYVGQTLQVTAVGLGAEMLEKQQEAQEEMGKIVKAHPFSHVNFLKAALSYKKKGLMTEQQVQQMLNARVQPQLDVTGQPQPEQRPATADDVETRSL